MVIFKGKVHLLLALSFILLSHAPLSLIPGVILGSFLPDIDHPKSTLGRWFNIHKYIEHRAEIHSLFAALAFSSLAYIISPYLGIGLFWGYTNHLWGDYSTPYSLPKLWYPYKK